LIAFSILRAAIGREFIFYLFASAIREQLLALLIFLWPNAGKSMCVCLQPPLLSSFSSLSFYGRQNERDGQAGRKKHTNLPMMPNQVTPICRNTTFSQTDQSADEKRRTPWNLSALFTHATLARSKKFNKIRLFELAGSFAFFCAAKQI